MNNIYIFYDAHTFEIITILKPILNNIDIDEFIYSRIKYDDRCKDLKFEDIKYIVEDSKDYDYYTSTPTIKTKMYIEPTTEQFIIKIIQDPAVRSNSTYNAQNAKRDYTVENILDMYNNDYIEFNLRNIISSNNGVQFEFVKLSDMNIRPEMLDKRWKDFFADPFLTESAKDKLILGRSIKEVGTFYPIVAHRPDPKSNTVIVFEGTHRVTSLKLLQAEGELSDDFEMLCILMPFDFEGLFDTKMGTSLNEPIRIRSIIEIGFGTEILVNKGIHGRVLASMEESGYETINEYTYEYTGYTWTDMMFAVDMYPHWLRDLTYKNMDKVKPSKIINDKERFNSWLKGD